MDLSTPINNKSIPFPLHRAVVNPRTQVVTVYSGMLFPSSSDVKLCAFYFGDTNVATPVFVEPTEPSVYLSMVSAVSGFSSFLPNWSNDSDDASKLIPKFTTNYRYAKPGTYKIRCALITGDNTVYIGTSTTVVVGEPVAGVSGPGFWAEASEKFIPTDDSTTSKPAIIIDYDEPISTTLPFTVDFRLVNFRNSEGSLNVVYIHWKCNNGASITYGVRLEPQYAFAFKFSTTYNLLPVNEKIEVTATIVYRVGNDFFSYEVKEALDLENIGNIAVSRTATVGSVLDGLLEDGAQIAGTDIVTGNVNYGDLLYDICAIPATSSILPVTTRFTFKTLPRLKLILCDFDDGTYDVIPVASSVNQSTGASPRVIRTNHKYVSANHTDFYPVFIYLYELEDGTFYAERRTLRTRLRYSLGIFEQVGNHRLIPISSSTNFRKFNGISTVISYIPNTKTAEIVIRLSIGTNPKHILSLDKIIWNINGTGIVQDRDTSLSFGYLRLVVPVPYYRYRISATVYRRSRTNALIDEVYGVYDGGAFNILSKQDSDAQNAKLKIISQQREFDPLTRLPTSEDSNFVVPNILTREIEEAEYLDNLSTEAQFAGVEMGFDRAIIAEAPAANFLNRNHPTFVSTETRQYSTAESVGFFKPSKTALTVIDPGLFTFYLDLEAVESNKLYYFPDPFKYGSETTSLVFDIDVSSFKKGTSYSYLRNLPAVTDASATYNGYSSTYVTETTSPLLCGGYIADSKQDVFGNTYSLVKNSEHFLQNHVTQPNDIKQNINVNGYLFYDVLFDEGSSYNYSLSGSLNNIVRTGFTTQTEKLTADNTRYPVLNFGRLRSEFSFTPTSEPLHISTQYLNPIRSEAVSCGAFIDGFVNALDEFMSSDLSAFPGAGSYYYTELFEAGTHSLSPYQRPLLDNTDALTQSTTAVFTESLFLSNTDDVVDIDCGKFYTRYNIIQDKTMHISDTYMYTISSASSRTELTQTAPISSSIIKRKNTPGQIFIKTSNGTIHTLLNLEFNKYRYGTTAYNELSSVVSFDIAYDTIFIQTVNYLIVDKIKYDSGTYKKPAAIKSVLKHNDDHFNRVSNRLKVGDSVYFTIMKKLEVVHTNQIYIIPYIYKYSKKVNMLERLYPLTDDTEVDERFNITDSGVEYVELATPRICFSKNVNKINLSYLLKDLNKSPTLVSLMFRPGSSITFDNCLISKLNAGVTTLPGEETFITLFTSQEPQLTNNYYIL
jgi:hypothetical protein